MKIILRKYGIQKWYWSYKDLSCQFTIALKSMVRSKWQLANSKVSLKVKSQYKSIYKDARRWAYKSMSVMLRGIRCGRIVGFTQQQMDLIFYNNLEDFEMVLSLPGNTPLPNCVEPEDVRLGKIVANIYHYNNKLSMLFEKMLRIEYDYSNDYMLRYYAEYKSQQERAVIQHAASEHLGAKNNPNEELNSLPSVVYATW